ncbi:hypothetical protein QYF36_019308 [Acer negundo]|nr:hypothetical protein QYF36_019308 [Acer negundo]
MEMDSSDNSKRKRTSDGKQIAISWPSISLKFVSKENEKRYHASLSRNLIFERGIDLIDIVEDDILDVVTDRVWFNFVAQAKDACENLVREFYANFVEEDFNEGRGVVLIICVSPRRILRNSKATWPSNNNYLPHGHLFCSCSLDPSTDRSEINLRRAKLIYAIEKSDTFMSPPPMLDSKVLKEIACPVARRVSQDTPTTLPSRVSTSRTHRSHLLKLKKVHHPLILLLVLIDGKDGFRNFSGKLKRAMLQFLVDLIVLKQVMPLYLIGLINKVLKLVCFQGIRD